MESYLQNEKILTVILAYNEEKHIRQVMSDLKQGFNIGDVLVIDGESKDKTVSIVKEFGAWVMEIPSSLGIGGAMEAALLFAKEKKYDYLVRIDGDGQHLPKNIPKLLLPMLQNQADMILGSRFKEGWNQYRSSFLRFFAIRFFSFIISTLIKQKIFDTTSGMFVINKKAIQHLSDLKNFEYSEVVTFLILKKANFKILEIPVSMNQRIGSKSSFTLIKSFYYMALGMMSIFLTKMTKYNDA